LYQRVIDISLDRTLISAIILNRWSDRQSTLVMAPAIIPVRSTCRRISAEEHFANQYSTQNRKQEADIESHDSKHTVKESASNQK
jgi:hypothetical protein